VKKRNQKKSQMAKQVGGKRSGGGKGRFPESSDGKKRGKPEGTVRERAPITKRASGRHKKGLFILSKGVRQEDQNRKLGVGGGGRIVLELGVRVTLGRHKEGLGKAKPSSRELGKDPSHDRRSPVGEQELTVCWRGERTSCQRTMDHR